MSANKFADKLRSAGDSEAIMRMVSKEFSWPGVMTLAESATAIHFISKALAEVLATTRATEGES